MNLIQLKSLSGLRHVFCLPYVIQIQKDNTNRLEILNRNLKNCPLFIQSLLFLLFVLQIVFLFGDGPKFNPTAYSSFSAPLLISPKVTDLKCGTGNYSLSHPPCHQYLFTYHLTTTKQQSARGYFHIAASHDHINCLLNHFKEQIPLLIQLNHMKLSIFDIFDLLAQQFQVVQLNRVYLV